MAEPESALHVVWKFPSTDAVSVNALQNRMSAVEQSRLFDLRSLSFRDGKASAILTPSAPLEEIVAVIWNAFGKPDELRLVEAKPGRRAFTERSWPRA